MNAMNELSFRRLELKYDMRSADRLIDRQRILLVGLWSRLVDVITTWVVTPLPRRKLGGATI